MEFFFKETFGRGKGNDLYEIIAFKIGPNKKYKWKKHLVLVCYGYVYYLHVV